MICPICGKEYSDKIIDIHMKDCNKEEETNEDAVRLMAKEKGISHYWNKSIQTLIEELEV